MYQFVVIGFESKNDVLLEAEPTAVAPLARLLHSSPLVQKFKVSGHDSNSKNIRRNFSCDTLHKWKDQ